MAGNDLLAQKSRSTKIGRPSEEKKNYRTIENETINKIKQRLPMS